MLDWKLISKHPPPKDGRHFLAAELIGPMDEEDDDGNVIRRGIFERKAVVAYWFLGGVVPYPWNGSLPINVKYTHWAEIGPLPTMEPGHE